MILKSVRCKRYAPFLYVTYITWQWSNKVQYETLFIYWITKDRLFGLQYYSPTEAQQQQSFSYDSQKFTRIYTVAAKFVFQILLYYNVNVKRFGRFDFRLLSVSASVYREISTFFATYSLLLAYRLESYQLPWKTV